MRKIRSIYILWRIQNFSEGDAYKGGGEIIYIISGGGEGPFLVRYEKCVYVWEGDAVRFKSDTKSGGLWHTANRPVARFCIGRGGVQSLAQWTQGYPVHQYQLVSTLLLQ